MVDFIVIMYCFLTVIAPCILLGLVAVILIEKINNPEKTIKQILKEL